MSAAAVAVGASRGHHVSAVTTIGDGTTPTDDFPRTVGRGFAITTIERHPERVVATADRDQLDVLLAMGVLPVLYGRSGDYDPIAPWIEPALVEGVEASRMAGPFEVNLEAIAAARPDLIVDAWADEAIHASLSRIAPTIEIKLDNTDSWQSAQRLAGQAMAVEEAAEAAIAETEAVLASEATRLTSLAGMSIAVAFIDTDALVIIPGNEIGGRVFSELGLTVHPTPDGASGRYSIENINELLGDADMIVSFDYGNLGGQETNPLFQRLPAVKAGRYVAVGIETATACYQESTLSLRWAASRLADALLS